jgi:hypothetical protein
MQPPSLHIFLCLMYDLTAPLSSFMYGYSWYWHSLLLTISLLRAYFPFRLLRLPPAVCRKYGVHEGRSQGGFALTHHLSSVPVNLESVKSRTFENDVRVTSPVI